MEFEKIECLDMGCPYYEFGYCVMEREEGVKPYGECDEAPMDEEDE